MSEEKSLQAREPESAGAVRSRITFQPLTDIVETPEGFLITADVPGADASSVDVTLEDGVLSLRARSAEQAGGRRAVHSEYLAGDYRRDLTVSEAVDADRIEAAVRDGVLRVSVPKAEAARPRKIPVRAG